MAGSRLDFFERDLKVATADLEPAAISKLLAQTAREARAAAIDAGEASPDYQTYVNGAEGGSEDQVRPDGVILYEFHYLDDVAQAALPMAIQLSPEKSGRFKRSWFLMVDGAAVAKVPDGATSFTLTNDQPYSRKIEVGHMKMSVPPGIVEKLRQQLQRQYGNLATFERRFIPLDGAYVLKGDKRRPAKRKDRKPGRALTYPALVVTLR